LRSPKSSVTAARASAALAASGAPGAASAGGRASGAPGAASGASSSSRQKPSTQEYPDGHAVDGVQAYWVPSVVGGWN
jgi:hypothetical protein